MSAQAAAAKVDDKKAEAPVSRHIKQTGKSTDVKPEKGKYFTLDELTAFVEGYIEIVGLSNTLVMIVNDEGMESKSPKWPPICSFNTPSAVT